ncbi:copper homeostasis protein CutC [Roseibium algae]|uniref:PF03932 family protein CutC n=1 Tax=Roseibium algae TaxID=3123038 RepID=A0ABU8TJD9_9HYPH
MSHNSQTLSQASTQADKSVLLEVCVDTIDGLIAAVEGGADRIELCSALSLGGLTPSVGFMQQAATFGIPVYPLIRPRHGGFHYSTAELDTIKRDIDAAAACSLPGVVIGACTSAGHLDTKVLTDLIRHAGPMNITLHRAFDLVPDQQDALETAIELGFSRILTSGGAKTAMDGMEAISALAYAAKNRISIMPGSGIQPSNVASFLATLPITEIHASCSSPQMDEAGKISELGFLSGPAKQTNADVVRAMISEINKT